jgi:succinoglycan biosynthesis transport protein ExoP
MGTDRYRPEISSLPDFLRLLGRRRWVILASLLLVPVAAFVVTLFQQAKFEASADVLLSRQNLAGSLSGVEDPSLGDAERVVSTQAELARSRLMADRVLDAVGTVDMSADEFLESSEVEGKADSDLLEFRVTAGSRELAAQLATEYARQFTLYREELDRGTLRAAREGVETQLADLEAAGDDGTPFYRSLEEKAEQLRTLEVLQGTNTSLVRPATDAEQVEPRPRRNILLGIVVGLAIGVGLAFLGEALDTRVRTVGQVAAILEVPLLARIPPPPKRFRKANRLVTLGEPFGADAEPFRILRTNLDLANARGEARSIMVTSAVAGEGKSTTVANLAVTLARTGQDLILVDLDLRRPALAGVFDLQASPGLVDVARGRIRLEDAITEVPIGGPAWGAADERAPSESESTITLDVLPAGRIPRDLASPGALGGTPALHDLVVSLTERNDLVLVDAPPLLSAGDALALSTEMDALFLVCNVKSLRAPMLREAVRVLQASPARNLGFVLAGVEQEDAYGYLGTSRDRAGDRVS